MRAVVLADNLLPILSDNGSSVHLWSLCEGLNKNGFEVHMVSFNHQLPKWARILQDTSIDFPGKIVFHPVIDDEGNISRVANGNLWKNIIRPNESEFYPGARFSAIVKKVLSEISPDIIFAWAADAIVAASDYHNEHLIGLVTDMDFLVRRYRRKYSKTEPGLKPFMRKFLTQAIELKFPMLYLQVLNRCQKIVCSANHHAEWLKSKNIKNVKYFPIAVPDRSGIGWNIRKASALQSTQPPKVSIIGNVNGIATLSGLHFLVDEMMPSLSQIAKQTKFELHLIGGGELDSSLTKALNYPWIRRRGWVGDIQEEFISSTIMLVPIPIPLGFRTRIAEAFSYGTCVVAHSNNGLGMPELKNSINILMSQNGGELVHEIGECLANNQRTRNLGEAGRYTYVNSYDGNKVIRDTLKYCLS